MPLFIRIRNWQKYQHYKERNPPWVKLHRELLTSQTWVELDDASRVLAVACILLAAASDNKIPASTTYLRRVAYLNSDPDIDALVRTGFVELVNENNEPVADASKVLAPASKLHTNARPETETETEQRQITPPTPANAGVSPPAKRAAKKVPLPEGFAVSPQVAAWAAARGYLDLDRHLDAFCRKAQAKGYRYADWDAAFMEAIREDWAKLRAQPPPGREDREARQRATYEGLTGKRAGNERSNERVIDGEVRRIA